MSTKRWRQVEEQVAADTGGQAQPGSGNTVNRRGDTRLHGIVRAQCKEVERNRRTGRPAKSTTLKWEDWEEVEDQALRAGEMPAMVIEFEGREPWLAVVDYNEWVRYVEWLKERKGV